MQQDKSVLQVVGKRIQKLRQQKGFTQQQFSEMVGISTNYLSDLERGVSSPRMEKLELKDFLNYCFLSSVKFAPDGKRAAFVVANCCPDDNSYTSRLWLYDGRLRQLTDMGSERSFIWDGDDRILFPAVRSEKEEKRREAQEEFTSYYMLDLNGGEALPAFTLPFAAESIKKLDTGVYAVLGSIDANCPDYYMLDEDARAKVAKERADGKDYEVFDEEPFWANGGGIINKRRTALFIVETEPFSVKRITEPFFSADAMCVSGDCVIYMGSSYTAKPGLRGGSIYSLNFRTLEQKLICTDESLYLNGLTAVGDKVWLSAAEGSRHGLNENDWVYELDTVTGELRVLRKEEHSMYGSVGSDCRYGGGASKAACGSSLYHTTTREGSALLYRLDPDGSDSPV